MEIGEEKNIPMVSFGCVRRAFCTRNFVQGLKIRLGQRISLPSPVSSGVLTAYGNVRALKSDSSKAGRAKNVANQLVTGLCRMQMSCMKFD